MKKIFLMNAASILLIAALGVMAGCSGSFYDPGHISEIGLGVTGYFADDDWDSGSGGNGYGDDDDDDDGGGGNGYGDDDDDDDDGGGDIPSELVGSWGIIAGSAKAQSFKINADGTGTWGPENEGISCTWSVSGSKLTVKLTVAGTTTTGSAKWSVSGGKLTLSEGSGTLQAFVAVGPLDKL
jgi:hypothetical protein